jgi:hypothetical protein
MRQRAGSEKPPRFEKPTEEDMRQSLVRLDRIEIWGARAYVFQALPGYAGSVRQGVIGLFRDGRVVYMDTSGIISRRQRAASWWGHIDDLGTPVPAPRVFKAAKVMRAQRVSSRSFVIRLRGKLRIVCFTGLPVPRDLSKLLSAGKAVLESVPHVGTVVQVADIGVARAHGALHGHDAVAAATVWRSVLNGDMTPATLPLRDETSEHRQAAVSRPGHRHAPSAGS